MVNRLNSHGTYGIIYNNSTKMMFLGTNNNILNGWETNRKKILNLFELPVGGAYEWRFKNMK